MRLLPLKAASMPEMRPSAKSPTMGSEVTQALARARFSSSGFMGGLLLRMV